ncbi:hypothetical protein RSAG8_11073, partial [Rhizoctonia solani AG-8 WAC10335]
MDSDRSGCLFLEFFYAIIHISSGILCVQKDQANYLGLFWGIPTARGGALNPRSLLCFRGFSEYPEDSSRCDHEHTRTRRHMSEGRWRIRPTALRETESARVNYEPLGHVRDPDKRHSTGFTLESSTGELPLNSRAHTLRCKPTIDIVDIASSCVHFQPHWSQVSPRRCGTWALLPRCNNDLCTYHRTSYC